MVQAVEATGQAPDQLARRHPDPPTIGRLPDVLAMSRHVGGRRLGSGTVTEFVQLYLAVELGF